jgi:Flp pilus assembly secretin CpaC
VDNLNPSTSTTVEGTVVPGFDTQTLEAAVEMEDGQTFAVFMPTPNASARTDGSGEKAVLLVLVTPHLVAPQAAGH